MLTLTTSLLGNAARVAGVPLTDQERDMLHWALETMGFVMPSRGVFTGQQWSRIIGNNAARFTASATDNQGTQLTAYGLTYAMALDNIVKQLPQKPNP